MLPDPIAEHLQNALSGRLLQARSVSGGTINQVMRVETSDGPLFLKWQQSAPPGAFAAEAFGLQAIGASGTIRVPAVYAMGEDLDDQGLGYLALEFVPSVEPRDPTGFVRRFGDDLARLHQVTSAQGEQNGLSHDNYIGVTPQKNLPRSSSWAEFFIVCRLRPQIALARSRGLLPPTRDALLQTVVEATPERLADIPSEVSLIHGDLWSGNFLCTVGDEPVLVDPAAYYGHREMEMAYVELFGGFPAGFLAAYNDYLPLDSGYVQRRPLHQLYHLINHLNHFGETYGPAVERAANAVLVP